MRSRKTIPRRNRHHSMLASIHRVTAFIAENLALANRIDRAHVPHLLERAYGALAARAAGDALEPGAANLGGTLSHRSLLPGEALPAIASARGLSAHCSGGYG